MRVAVRVHTVTTESPTHPVRSQGKGEGEMNNETGTVFVIDDEPAVCRALSRMLSAAGYEVRAFESAEGFLAEGHAETPGCLVLDICLPGLDGMELQRSLLSAPCPHPIVFLTGRSDIQTSVSAMKAGAVDFLTKPIEGERLVAAIDRALQRDAERRLEYAIRSAIQRRFDKLTPREKQVMDGIIRGRLNKVIAAELGIGEKTVKVHRARLMEKMGVRSVAELVPLGARIGLAIGLDLRIRTSVHRSDPSHPNRNGRDHFGIAGN
jgi:FixJ family two-component response regulator